MYRTLIDVATLAALEAPLILDCRFNLADTAAGERAYAQSHLPGAVYAHLDRDLSSPITPSTGRHPLPDPAQLMAKLQAAGLSERRQVVVYDDAGGAIAARAWWLLRWLGHEAVALLDGGWQAWCEAGQPLRSDAAKTLSATQAVDITPLTALQIDVEALQQALDAGQVLLFDARAGERYRGEVEPLDPVAGHVPGAVNAPLTDNLADGRFLPPAQLRQRWLTRLDGAAPETVVHMCGSGVTACHNLLAMEHAGLCGSRLYAGSWSEWIRDPGRAVATGPASR
jgi:thiosulfate/3-mercaptopyruvate sulfurtransferase